MAAAEPSPRHLVVFQELRDLIQALACCTPREEMFPGAIRRHEAGYGLPLARFGSWEQFSHLAAQHGWRVKVAAPEAGREVLFCETIGCTLVHTDPLLARPRSRPGLTSAPSPPQGYLLGARNTEESRAILDTLTRYRALGLRARPVAGRPSQPGPFAFFWWVPAGEVPPAVLQAAPRTWWGPLGGQGNIFTEWPYQLKLAVGDQDDVKLLRRLPWGVERGLVLLSREEPRLLVVEVNPEQPLWEELVEVVEIMPASQPRTVIPATPPERLEAKFPVRLQFRAGTHHQRLSRRLEQLEQEIRAKQLLRDRLQSRAAGLKAPPAAFPLYFYAAEPDRLPFSLRRLLLEWSDQEHDLPRLRYGKVAADSLPWLPGHGEFHVLTTAAALGEADGRLRDDHLLGLRLKEYRPAGPLGEFELLPQWAFFGLRLFVPAGRDLTLYPDLPPSRLAAEKLAQALLPAEHPDPAHWLILLAPGPRGEPLAALLPQRALVPLKEAFHWECAIPAPPELPFVQELAVKNSGQRLLANLTSALEEAVTHRARVELEAVRETLKQQLAEAAKAMESRRQAATDLARSLAEQHSTMTKIEAKAQELKNQAYRLKTISEQLFNTLSIKGIEELHKVYKYIQEVSKNLDDLIKEL